MSHEELLYRELLLANEVSSAKRWGYKVDHIIAQARAELVRAYIQRLCFGQER